MLTIICLLGLLQTPAPAPVAPPVTTLTTGAVITESEWEATLKSAIARGAVDTLMTSALVEGGQASVAMLHRKVAETNALIHDHATEIYFILEGSGTITTGGTLQNPTGNDLTRLGAGMSHTGVHIGGTSRRVGPKDVIVVPGGMAHRFSQLDGEISYLVFRFDPSARRPGL